MADLTWVEVRDAIRLGAGVMLPIGSTEQHGPHLPLATDSLLASSLCLAVAQSVNMLVAPAITYGYRSRPLTGGGQGFVGTTSLRGETLMAMIRDVLREFLRQGFERLVVLNWHYENSNFVYEAAFEALEPHSVAKARIVVFEHGLGKLSDQTVAKVFGGSFPGLAIEHAATYETSLMLHLHPELVHFERAVDDQSARRPWYDVIPTPDAFVSKSGVLWKATEASPEKGKLLWSEIVPQVQEGIVTELDPTQAGK
jgi:creatinine amidohydrolase